MQRAHLVGAGYGMSQCIMMFVFAAGYGYGATLVDNGELNFQDLVT